MHIKESSPVMDVVILGAGPYGLSIAAHLNRLKVPYRIFGRPMQSWQSNMPKGMLLKSDGFATRLYDPDGAFTLQHYCAETNQPYADVGIPVPVEVFAAYGIEFQKRMVPSLEQLELTSVKSVPQGFEVCTEAGERFLARRVVIAAGITHFGWLPQNWSDCRANLRRTVLPTAISHHSKDGKLPLSAPAHRPSTSLPSFGRLEQNQRL